MVPSGVGKAAKLLLLLIPSALSQTFQVGVKAGVPFAPYFDTGSTGSVHGGAQYSSASRRYTLGVGGEFRIWRNVGLELDAMYHRLGYHGSSLFVSNTLVTSVFQVTGNSWDFPLLAKYHFGRTLHPYAAGGVTLRYIGPVHEGGESTELSFPVNETSPIDTSSPSDLRKRLYPGLTAAGGCELRVGRLKISPELRYTHWTANISGQNGVLRLGPQQLELLLGIAF